MAQVKRKPAKKVIQKKFGRSYVLGLKRHISRIEEALDKEQSAHMDIKERLDIALERQREIIKEADMQTRKNFRIAEETHRLAEIKAEGLQGRVIYAGGDQPECLEMGNLHLCTKQFPMGYPPLKPGDVVMVRAVVSNFDVNSATSTSVTIKPDLVRVLDDSGRSGQGHSKIEDNIYDPSKIPLEREITPEEYKARQRRQVILDGPPHHQLNCRDQDCGGCAHEADAQAAI